jgi:hypothetical protein
MSASGGTDPLPVVALGGDGVTTRLIQAVDAVVSRGLGPYALVGGLAVIANLNRVHRATGDIDTVADDDDGAVARLVTALIEDANATLKPSGDGVVLADGTKVDIIRTGAWEPDALPDDDVQRVFIVAHWWAVQTAAPVRLVAMQDGTVTAETVVNLARPAPLVAAKLQSRLTRKGATKDKELSDVYDIYRLLEACDRDGEISDELVTAPVDISAFCVQQLRAIFTDGSDRWARRINASFQTAAVTPAALEVAGALAIERIGAAKGNR